METPENETFRDSIGTVTKEGKRAWVFPKKPSGKLYEYRKIVSYFLLVFFISKIVIALFPIYRLTPSKNFFLSIFLFTSKWAI